MPHITYTTKGTCSRQIEIQINENNVVEEVAFLGGCSGNTKGICALVKGMNVDDVIERLEGIKCGPKNTSCPDQLSKALSEYKNNKD